MRRNHHEVPGHLRKQPRLIRPTIERLEVSVYRVPTETQESDGTLEWDSTTMVLAEVFAAGLKGIGFTYAGESTACLIREKLVEVVRGSEVLAVRKTWDKMVQAIRNLGRPGVASTAIAAVDIALWDLKAKFLSLPLVSLLGQVRESVPAYGSGGFTSYANKQLTKQLGGWADEGLRFVK